jgi:hypothetical protein
MLVLLLSAVPVAAAFAAGATPDAGARAFYAVYASAKVMGIPSAAQQRRLAPVVSAELAAALRAAGDAEERHFKATKNQEPPLWEGDPFSSLFEGAQQAAVGTCAQTGERADCDVVLTARDPATRKQTRWHDHALLVRERGQWVVDDIAYGGSWDFGPKGTLRANLKETAAYRP